VPPTSEELNDMNEEEATPSAQNEEPLDKQRRSYKFKPHHPTDNLLTDISTGIRTRSSL